MRYLWLLLLLPIMGMSQTYNVHDTEQKVDNEFENVYNQAQPRQFKVVTTTPNYTDLQDGEMVYYSSSSINPLVFPMLRIGTTIYVGPQYQIIRGR